MLRHVNGLNKGQAVRLQKHANLAEIAVQELWPHCFDHFNGNQLVELASKIPIVIKQQGDSVFQARTANPFLCKFQLFF